MTYLLFATALGLSAVAAYYSIMGLVAIFSAAVIPIMIMGSLLEASKLVVASWLYRSWKGIPVLMKTYFTVALLILMMLTSMGIFGYLSKAHLDQAVPSGDIAAKLSFIDEKINTEKENINAARKEIAQLDAQIDRYTELGNVSKGVNVRRTQQAERKRALDEIGAAQAQIAKLREERQPIASEVRKVEAEVGPIKYIADLIYGDQAKDEGFLEKAVRIVILLIVAVFDPLAVLMLVAANWQMKSVEKSKVKKSIEEFVPQPKEFIPEPVPEPEIRVNAVMQPREETSKVIEAEDDLVFEEDIKVEKPDWQPELYERVGVKTNTFEEKEIGRYESDLQEMEKQRKVQSFLHKVGTIERDIDDLQNNKS